MATISDFLPDPTIKPKHQLVWLGAASFEERCAGSIRQLSKLQAGLAHAVLIDYPTRVRPEREGELKRSRNRESILKLLPRNTEIRRLPSYRFGAMLGLLHEIEARVRKDWTHVQFVFDITCLTKIHTLALAYWMASAPTVEFSTVAYTRPRDYGSPIRKIWGKGSWVETVVAPFDLEPEEGLKANHGILMLGHEGDRLRLALDEVDIDEGIVLAADSDDPRLSLVANTQNKWLFDDIERRRRDKLVLKRVSILDMRTLMQVTSEAVRHTKRREARLVLYPFGPKPIIFAVALSAVTEYPAGTWYAYPVPRSYDVDYTIGVERTLWSEISPGNS